MRFSVIYYFFVTADSSEGSREENRTSLSPEERVAIAAEVATLQSAALTNTITDDVVNNLTDPALSAALSEMVGLCRQDLLAHPEIRGGGPDENGIIVYAAYEKRALITALVEQGISFSPEVLNSLVPLSLIIVPSFDVSALWGEGHWLRIAASRVT